MVSFTTPANWLVRVPRSVWSQAAALYAAGAARVEYGTPHGLSPEDGLRLLGTQVLPALRAGGALSAVE
jgi:hypothetical protein